MDSKRFKTARKSRGLTLTEVADRLGVSSSLPGHWERGTKTPSLAKLEAVAKLFNVSVSWLTGDPMGKPLPDQDQGHAISAIDVRSAHATSLGLRDLASNSDLVNALGITTEEWQMLLSLQAPDRLTATGYLAVLMAVRANLR